MKKIIILCTLVALALVSVTFVYAGRSSKSNEYRQPIQNNDVVKCERTIELVPSLFFF